MVREATPATKQTINYICTYSLERLDNKQVVHASQRGKGKGGQRLYASQTPR